MCGGEPAAAELLLTSPRRSNSLYLWGEGRERAKTHLPHRLLGLHVTEAESNRSLFRSRLCAG